MGLPWVLLGGLATPALGIGTSAQIPGRVDCGPEGVSQQLGSVPRASSAPRGSVAIALAITSLANGSIALGPAVWAIALTHTNARSVDQSTALGVSSSALVALFPMVIGLARGRHAGAVAARNRSFPARLRYIFLQEARPAFPSGQYTVVSAHCD